MEASCSVAYEFHAGTLRDLIMIAMYSPVKLSVDVLSVIADRVEEYKDGLNT